MLFPTVQFAVFFACVFLLGWAVSGRTLVWKGLLLIASWIFYAAFDPRFLPLLIALPCVHHGLALAIERHPSHARALVRLAVALDLALLATFKYQGFLAASANDLLARAGLSPALHAHPLTLPLGVSFVTFQAMSYVIDVGRGVMKPATALDAMLYVSFFPHLVAGPIVRASEFVPQVQRSPDPTRIEASRAVLLIVFGLFKKVVVASLLASALVDPFFARPSGFSPAQALLAVYGYAAQIYSDFSGYTDIAIGCALLLGVRFPQNFNAPYRAASLQDFWRRWHMTLSRWLRDYLYISLGGARGGTLHTWRNLLLTMLLGGLWHGAAWTFVLWGALHGLALCAERFVGWSDRAAAASRPARAVGIAVTFHLVCAAWVLFRAGTLDRARDVFFALVHAHPAAAPVSPWVTATVALSLASHAIPDAWLDRVHDAFDRLHPVAQGALVATALSLLSTLGPPGVAPFIYFQF